MGDTKSPSSLTVQTNHGEITCKALVGADGVRSPVRKALGIKMHGQKGNKSTTSGLTSLICLALQNFINVHFRSAKLTQLLTEKNLHAMLHFIYNQKTVSVLVSHDQSTSEFVLQVPYFPPIENESDYGSERCA